MYVCNDLILIVPMFVLFSLLEMLPEMFKDTRETDAVLGPVVAAGLEALKVSDAFKLKYSKLHNFVFT